MKLLLDHQRKELLANGQANLRLRDNGLAEYDFNLVVKLFCPWGAATWLLTELYPEDPDIAFGLCCLGMGCPELGNVSLSELESVKVGTGRDRTTSAKIRKALDTVVSPKAKLTKAIRKPKAMWVEPQFVAEVEYRDITSEGLLRASSFKGLSKR
ncbi:DUF2958 domain-containing protein [Bradyrhizobium sp. SZCCHNRI3042]|uniref:DUF2958 domain-containing protein n=1 Tax=Bradyrhizobium sp. SZCCHNRI3042 TaxID=3057291 RepID=UPI002915D134|nr:DUF2958 domain-containing protein [Bradyrhizobium sp. SZCCHNRI3042]